MLENTTSLYETAERFHKDTEFIWNLSLQFQDFLRPEIGENGLITYSHFQRQLIGKIIHLQNQGYLTREIFTLLENNCDPGPEHVSALNQTATQNSLNSTICGKSVNCDRTIKRLSEQVKFLWKQICQLKKELNETRAEKNSSNSPSFSVILDEDPSVDAAKAA